MNKGSVNELDRAFLAELATSTMLRLDHNFKQVDSEVLLVETEVSVPNPSGIATVPEHGQITSAYLSALAPRSSDLSKFCASYAIFPLWMVGESEHAVSMKHGPAGSRLLLWTDPTDGDAAFRLLLVPLEKVSSEPLTCRITRRIAADIPIYEKGLIKRVVRTLSKLFGTVGVIHAFTMDPGFTSSTTVVVQAPPDTSIKCLLNTELTLQTPVGQFGVDDVRPNRPSAVIQVDLSIRSKGAVNGEASGRDARMEVATGPHISGPRLTTQYMLPQTPVWIAIAAVFCGLVLQRDQSAAFILLTWSMILGGVLYPRPLQLWRDSNSPTALAFSDLERHSQIAFSLNVLAVALGAMTLNAACDPRAWLVAIVFIAALTTAAVVGLLYYKRSAETIGQFSHRASST